MKVVVHNEMKAKRRFSRILRGIKEYLSCTYTSLLEEDDIIDENCVVFKGLSAPDPIGDIFHIGNVLFKVLRTNFEIKRLVFAEEVAGEVITIVEFTDNIMAENMLRKAHLVLPAVKTERYDGLVSLV